MFVSNTSTLVLLAKVGCLETFLKVSGPVLIPAQVRSEALFEKESHYAMLIRKLINEKKILIESANKHETARVLSEFRLDDGEAAAYVLFNKKKHKAILTDDGELIKLCKLENVPFICAMAIIIRLYERHHLTKHDALEKLENLSKIGRYSKDLYEHFKSEVK